MVVRRRETRDDDVLEPHAKHGRRVGRCRCGRGVAAAARGGRGDEHRREVLECATAAACGRDGGGEIDVGARGHGSSCSVGSTVMTGRGARTFPAGITLPFQRGSRSDTCGRSALSRTLDPRGSFRRATSDALSTLTDQDHPTCDVHVRLITLELALGAGVLDAKLRSSRAPRCRFPAGAARRARRRRMPSVATTPRRRRSASRRRRRSTGTSIGIRHAPLPIRRAGIAVRWPRHMGGCGCSRSPTPSGGREEASASRASGPLPLVAGREYMAYYIEGVVPPGARTPAAHARGPRGVVRDRGDELPADTQQARVAHAGRDR